MTVGLEETGIVSLNYTENPAAKKLLDAIVSILAEEFIQTAQQNPEIFTVKGVKYESCHLCSVLEREPERKEY